MCVPPLTFAGLKVKLGLGEFYGASQLFWFGVVNTPPRKIPCLLHLQEYTYIYFCNIYSTGSSSYDNTLGSQNRHGRYWGLQLPLIQETWRSLVWFSFKCKCPSKPLKGKEPWCAYGVSQDIPGTIICVCFSFPSPSFFSFPLAYLEVNKYTKTWLLNLQYSGTMWI